MSRVSKSEKKGGKAIAKSKAETPHEERSIPAFGVTSYDVARHAGVSQSAVSRCFRKSGGVARATRDKILKSAEELSYQPNALAQALISKRTNLVAVLISNLTNLYYPEVLAELGQRLAARGLRTLLFALPSESDSEDALNEIWRHKIDGAIAAVHLAPEQVRMFAKRRIALVLYNRVSDSEAVSSVCCDSAAGERQLVDRLLDGGHKRFGIIGGPEDSYIGEERVRGAIERLRQAGYVDIPVVRGEYSYETGRASLSQLLAQSPDIDAVICANDVMALGAMDAARHKHGRRIPEDMSVVGFDGVDPAGWSSYGLTSIRQPVRRMTEAAVSMLVERIKDPDLESERRLFPGQLLEGQSARIVSSPSS